MREIVVTCKNHGRLTIDKTFSEMRNGKLRYRCKICRRKQRLLWQIRLQHEHFDELFEKQNHKCAICNKEEIVKGKKGREIILAIDHCHKCKNHIRGLLCQACNTAIGKSNEDINLIKNAIEYLKKHSE